MKQLKVWLVSGTHSPGLCRLKTSEQHPSYRLQVDGRCALKIIIFFPFRAGLKPIPLDRITNCACESAAAKAIKSSLYKLWFLMTLTGRACIQLELIRSPSRVKSAEFFPNTERLPELVWWTRTAFELFVCFSAGRQAQSITEGFSVVRLWLAAASCGGVLLYFLHKAPLPANSNLMDVQV